MNLYRVTYTTQTLVAATSPLEARKLAERYAIQETAVSLPRVASCAHVRHVTESGTLPEGWEWSDSPLGSVEPLERWRVAPSPTLSAALVDESLYPHLQE